VPLQKVLLLHSTSSTIQQNQKRIHKKKPKRRQKKKEKSPRHSNKPQMKTLGELQAALRSLLKVELHFLVEVSQEFKLERNKRSTFHHLLQSFTWQARSILLVT